jgi:hypothetical protein
MTDLINAASFILLSSIPDSMSGAIHISALD